MIEKQIFQSWHTKDVNPIIVQKTKRFLSLNPAYKYTLFTDEEMDKYVNDNFPGEIADCYNRIQIIVAKVDFWRYLILYKEGGIYLDMDSNIDKSLDLLIKEDDDAIITAEGNPGLYVQWALMFVKEHPILKRTIELVVDNIKNNRFPNNIHQMTGPTVYTQAINEIHNKLFGEIIDHSRINNKTDVVFKKDGVSYRLFAKDYGEFATYKDMTTAHFLTTKNMHWRHAQQRMTILKNN